MPSPPPPISLLLFSKTTGYRHTSIPAGLSFFQRLASRCPTLFHVTASEDAGLFTRATLARFSVVVLLQCIGDVFTGAQVGALKAFVRGGGGVVGVHGAGAGMTGENGGGGGGGGGGDEWYRMLIGARFAMHAPAEEGVVFLEERNGRHFIVAGSGGGAAAAVPAVWRDEWYNFTTHPRENERLVVLLRGDPGSFKGGRHGDDHPLTWCQEFEGGRCFYTALGHFDEAYRDEWFGGLLERGVLWVAGREGDVTDTVG